jgi:putative hydrolase of the HAD superfamily
MSQPPLSDAFAHVRHWVFDLDNTLYPPEARLFDQIEVKMTDWVARALNVSSAEADRLRDSYWQSHGTTLAGLMEVHGVDPGPYLSEVHDIKLDHLAPDARLAGLIAGLPGRRIVYTNGTARYARRVLEARGLEGAFDAVYGVEEAGFQPKPRRAAFKAIFAADGVQPGIGAMFEDDPRNLAVPHELGMATVLVGPEALEAPHVHHHTDNLPDFLERLGPLTQAGEAAPAALAAGLGTPPR